MVKIQLFPLFCGWMRKNIKTMVQVILLALKVQNPFFCVYLFQLLNSKIQITILFSDLIIILKIMQQHLLKIVLFLAFVLEVLNLDSCPATAIDTTKTTLLKSGAFQFSSIQRDVYYELNTTSGSTILARSDIIQDSTVSPPTYSISSFRITGDSTWKILAVSRLGNCVGVKQGNNLVAYDTSNKVFDDNQTISLIGITYTSIAVSDDCRVIALTDSTGNKQMYMDSKKVRQFSQLTKFTNDFDYAINQDKELYLLGATDYGTPTQLGTFVKTVPLAIYHSYGNDALTIFTRDTATSGDAGLFFLDISNPTNNLSKTISASSINGSLILTMQDDNSIAILRDQTGLLYFANLLQVSTLTIITPLVLNSSTYNNLFKATSLVSAQGNLIVTYSVDFKLTYFRILNEQVFYLSDLTSNVEDSVQTFIAANAPQTLSSVVNMVRPRALVDCQPYPVDAIVSENADGSVVTNDDLVDDAPTVFVDNSTGTPVITTCDPTCASCQSGGICKSCNLGFVLNGTECLSCGNCARCNSKNTDLCTSCWAGQFLNTVTSTCQYPSDAVVESDPNCIQYNSDLSCSYCVDGYSVHGGKCTACTQQGCLSCSVSVDNCDSNQCSDGFVSILHPDKTTSCFECLTGCLGCTASTIFQCSNCSDGFHKAVDIQTGYNVCKQCPENCKTCNDGASCTKCDLNYSLNAAKTKCVPACDDICLTCSETNSSQCITCYSNAKLDTALGTCVPDKNCNLTQSCTACAVGYVISNKYCYLCTYTDPNCVACTRNKRSTCARCVAGFYINKDDECKACPQECVACLSRGGCTICKDKYHLVTKDNALTGSCQKCSSRCATCKGDDKFCTSCEGVRVLIGQKCIHPNRVELLITMGIQLEALGLLGQNGLSLTGWLAEKADQHKSERQDKITAQDCAIRRMKRGSSIIQSSLSVGSAADTEGISAGLKRTMDASPTLNGYPVIGSTITATVAIPSTSSSSSNNLGIILGIVIPLGILILVAIIVIVVKVAKRKEEIVLSKYEGLESGFTAKSDDKYYSDANTDKI